MHAHTVALHFMYYNFCKIHQTLRVTPAMEAGLCDHVWEISELIGLLAAERGDPGNSLAPLGMCAPLTMSPTRIAELIQSPTTVTFPAGICGARNFTSSDGLTVPSMSKYSGRRSHTLRGTRERPLRSHNLRICFSLIPIRRPSFMRHTTCVRSPRLALFSEVLCCAGVIRSSPKRQRHRILVEEHVMNCRSIAASDCPKTNRAVVLYESASMYPEQVWLSFFIEPEHQKLVRHFYGGYFKA